MKRQAIQPATGPRAHARSAMRKALSAAALTSALLAPGVAHADKVICDGNPLCMVVLVPVVAVAATIQALTPDPPEKKAAKYIRSGDDIGLRFVLESNPDLLRDPQKGHQLLLAASAAGNLVATGILLDAGVSASEGGSRALWYATSVAEIELLLSRGASADQMELMHMVSTFHAPGAADLLATVLDHRSIPLRDDPAAKGLLQVAVRDLRLPIVALLLQRGVDPTESKGRSTLAMLAYGCNSNRTACDQHGLAIAQALVDKGADVNFVERPSCQTALKVAYQVGNTPLATLLEQAGAVDHPPAEAQCLALCVGPPR